MYRGFCCPERLQSNQCDPGCAYTKWRVEVEDNVTPTLVGVAPTSNLMEAEVCINFVHLREDSFWLSSALVCAACSLAAKMH